MSSTSKQTPQLSSWEKRVLLAQLLRKKTSESQTFPLSFAQQRLWFLDQRESDRALYNIPIAVRLMGPLQLMVLEQSLNEIIERHESLRTSFAVVRGQPMQVIAPSLRVKLLRADLSTVPPLRQEGEVHRLATAEAQQPFTWLVVLCCVYRSCA